MLAAQATIYYSEVLYGKGKGKGNGAAYFKSKRTKDKAIPVSTYLSITLSNSIKESERERESFVSQTRETVTPSAAFLSTYLSIPLNPYFIQ